MRARLIRAFGRFHDVRAESDVRVASMVRAWEADIIVDLTGLTGPGRPGILAQRPAPVQVNWLGFAGSMGAPFVDYLLADAIAIPVSEQPHYQEWLALLPHCYLPHDSARVIAPAPSRQAAGLPARVFVFASFNNAYKFTPDVFAVWMRLLARVPKSVLWLPQPNEAARRNLRAQAQTHGIDPDRIVFAPYAPRPEDHLARLSLADLFLDTLPYNSHSTAVDALFAGVPIVTCIGESFAGRVAASALTAAGLPDLVTGSQDAYEALALALATDAPRLAAIRERLLGARATAPLFDSAGFTCDLEAAYTTMCERARRGLPPAPFAVPATRGSAP